MICSPAVRRWSMNSAPFGLLYAELKEKLNNKRKILCPFHFKHRSLVFVHISTEC